jgi:hypothetical protein
MKFFSNQHGIFRTEENILPLMCQQHYLDQEYHPLLVLLNL